MPRNLALAVMQWESGCDPKAVSKRQAKGLMQLMDDTARDLGVTNVFDPNQNIRGGVQYLAQQLAEFSSTDLALAAYNWGPERIRDRPRRSWADIAPEAPQETRDYVSGVIALARSFDSTSPVYVTSSGTHSTSATLEPTLVTMTIDNHLTETVSLFWVDFSGQETKYGTLQPRGGWHQPTYPGHVWKIRNVRGDEIQTLVATSSRIQPYIIN
jgi:hypothetical protein